MSQSIDAHRETGERFFKELADFAPVMIWRSGPDALCEWFNKPWLDFVGRSMEQEIGNGWTENVHPEDFDRCLEIYLSSFKGRSPFTMTYRMKRQDGVYREILDNGAAFYRNGEFAGYFGSCIDVTDFNSMEAQLRQAQKMDAVGKLTGGVAHDFNNMLQVIGGNLQLLEKDTPGDERAQRRLHNAQEAVSRGAKLTRQLLAYARKQSLAPRVINLSRLVHGIDDMLRRALGEAVEIEPVIAGGLWNVQVDPTQVETAILNLAVNARDAMQGRGKLTIEAGNVRLDDADCARRLDVTPGQYVMLAVSDTGCGMAPDLVERVFDPFFTTKREGEGTGLGLSMVHGFVKQSGGHITVYSEVGRGTTVRIYLPRSHEKLEDPEDVAPRVATRGNEVVLLVEDDAAVCATTADMLSELGYRVLKARDADAARVILEGSAAIDMLFTDVVMPGQLQTRDLVRLAQQRKPGLSVLYTSGYRDNAIIHGGRRDDGVDLLPKPYTREDLARKLRQVLERRPAMASENVISG